MVFDHLIFYCFPPLQPLALNTFGPRRSGASLGQTVQRARIFFPSSHNTQTFSAKSHAFSSYSNVFSELSNRLDPCNDLRRLANDASAPAPGCTSQPTINTQFQKKGVQRTKNIHEQSEKQSAEPFSEKNIEQYFDHQAQYVFSSPTAPHKKAKTNTSFTFATMDPHWKKERQIHRSTTHPPWPRHSRRWHPAPAPHAEQSSPPRKSGLMPPSRRWVPASWPPQERPQTASRRRDHPQGPPDPALDAATPRRSTRSKPRGKLLWLSTRPVP